MAKIEDRIGDIKRQIKENREENIRVEAKINSAKEQKKKVHKALKEIGISLDGDVTENLKEEISKRKKKLEKKLDAAEKKLGI